MGAPADSRSEQQTQTKQIMSTILHKTMACKEKKTSIHFYFF